MENCRETPEITKSWRETQEITKVYSETGQIKLQERGDSGNQFTRKYKRGDNHSAHETLQIIAKHLRTREIKRASRKT